MRAYEEIHQIFNHGGAHHWQKFRIILAVFKLCSTCHKGKGSCDPEIIKGEEKKERTATPGLKL